MNNYTLLPCSSVAKLQFFFSDAQVERAFFVHFVVLLRFLGSEITIREGMHYGMIMLFFWGGLGEGG